MERGYSKINLNHSNQNPSESMEISDLGSNTQLEESNNDPQKKSKIEQDSHFGNNGSNASHVVLKRNYSVSSSSSGKGGIWSMRRSCSTVSDRYSRIHDDQFVTSPLSISDGQGEEAITRSNKRRHKGGKILKACKRLFGLN